MTPIQADAETIMALRRATGLPVLKAREFLTTSAPELVQRILDGYRVRHIERLGSLPKELREKIVEASEKQSPHSFLCNPIEDDPEVGATVREVLERTSHEIEASYALDRPRGLCHLIWRTAQERLLRQHSITWYTPAQMNPGTCFD